MTIQTYVDPTKRHDFVLLFDVTDGNAPYTGLVQASNKTFYGTTESGGAYNDGTIFSVSVGP